MSNHNFSKFNSDLQKKLKDIGRKNGTAPPDSQDPADALLHYYYVDKMGEKLFKGQSDQDMKNIMYHGGELLNSKIEQTLNDTIKLDIGQSSNLLSGQHYQFNLTTKKPANRLSEAKLRNTLMMKHKLTAEQVEDLISSCKEAGNPTKMFTVQPIA